MNDLEDLPELNINTVVKFCPGCGNGLWYRIEDNIFRVRCSQCAYHKEYWIKGEIQ